MKQDASNLLTIRNDNRALVLEYIRRRPMSRVELSKETGLSKSAVTMITNEFVREGLLQETGTAETALGRRPILLDITANHRFAVGAALHRRRLSVSLVDLKQQRIDAAEARTADFPSPDAVVDWIAATAETLMGKNGLKRAACIGAGISSPGPLDHEAGRILHPPDFPLFYDYPIVARLRERLGMPAVLDNNAVLLATTEYYRDPPVDYRQFLYLVVADGIGSSIVSDGQIVRGAAGFAGELGHTSVDVHGEPCPCGNRGCLEQYATLAALKRRFGFDRFDMVAADAAAGDPTANEIMNTLADYLACAITNAVNFLDLEAVILYGELNVQPDCLFDRLRERVQARSVVSRSHEVAVLASRLGDEDAKTASAAAILNAYYRRQLS